MSKIELKVNFDRLTLGDLILYKTIVGFASSKEAAGKLIIEHAEEIRDMVARLLVDTEGNPLDEEIAKQQATNLSLAKLTEALSGVGGKVSKMEVDAANPPSGSG